MKSVAEAVRIAIKDYQSDKIKDRALGGARLLGIFSDPNNVRAFQDQASRDNGGGWVALFQCMFQVVSLEKKAVVRANATAAADKRLADAVSLVRKTAQTTSTYLTKKPLLALVRHMTTLLVHGGTVFSPVVRDYGKALQTLLSHPPHLEALGEQDWKRLMTVCWAGVLGDRITAAGDQWQDEGHDELDESADNGQEEVEDEDMLGNSSNNGGVGGYSRQQRTSVTQDMGELLLIMEILLGSSSAPLIPPFPTADTPINFSPSIGYSILLKVVRFIDTHPAETTGHFSVLRSCNLVLTELELNSRHELVQAGTKLLPKLVSVWLMKKKEIREQVLISLRLLMPWVTHDSIDPASREIVQECLQKLAERVPKEMTSGQGLEPLELHNLRLNTEMNWSIASHPYTLRGIEPGFDFTHEQALSWAVIDLYSQIMSLLRLPSSGNSFEEQGSSSEIERKPKRRRVEDPMRTLTAMIEDGIAINRLFSLQLLAFVVGRDSAIMNSSDVRTIIPCVISALESADEKLQIWGFLALSMTSVSAADADVSARVWASAIRKMIVPGVSRAASFCAVRLIKAGCIPIDTMIKDIGNFLKHIDYQGPPYPYDSVSSFLLIALEHVQSDVRLYSLNLGEKVLVWLQKHDLTSGTRGLTRMDATGPSDIVPLLTALSSLPIQGLSSPSIEARLPECPIVQRIIQEWETRELRAFILDGTCRSVASSSSSDQASILGVSKQIEPASIPSTTPEDETDPALSEKCRRICQWLGKQLASDILDWNTPKTGHAAIRSAERVRKSLDLIVTVITFLGCLPSTQTNVDLGDMQIGARLVEIAVAIRPELGAVDVPIAIQHFMWQGMTPLLPPLASPDSPWPIFLRANAEISGIRSDLLPHQSDATDVDAATKSKFLSVCWTTPEAADALGSLVHLSRQLTEGDANIARSASGNYASQNGTREDDDDMGQIRDAENGALQPSSESKIGRRASESLVSVLVSTRLASALFTSPNRTASKDVNLLNAFLASDGDASILIGRVVCSAARSGLIRLTVDAIDAINDMLEERISSYAWSRNESQLLLVLDFLKCSSPIWLLPEMADTDTAERAINLVQHITKRAAQGQAQSWRVRLHLLLLLDEYLDYDPNCSLWSRLEQDDDAGIAPSTAIRHALVDGDMRVRIRAATSTAGLLCLPELPASRHQDYYLETMDQQPRQPEYWNAFLTDILWKLNCAITSHATRSAALYHIYEVPFSASTFEKHLQSGLEAVCEHLGLSGLQDIWRECGPIVVTSLLGGGQKPLTLSPALCGFSDQATRAKSELEWIGALLLAEGHLAYFNLLCDTAGSVATEQAVKYIYSVIARDLSRSQLDPSTSRTDKRVLMQLSDNISSIPGAGKLAAAQVLETAGTSIAVNLFQLLGTVYSRSSIESNLSSLDQSAQALYNRLNDSKNGTTDSTPSLDGSAFLNALAFLQRNSPELDRKAICFNTVIEIFASIDDSSLISELRRQVYALTVVTSIFHKEIVVPGMLQFLLFETASLLSLLEVSAQAMAILSWGFEQVPGAKSDKSRESEKVNHHLKTTYASLGYVFARLGRVRAKVSSHSLEVLDGWLGVQIPLWRNNPVIWSIATQQAVSLWPTEMRQRLGVHDEIFFTHLAKSCNDAHPEEVMAICERLSQVMTQNGNEADRSLFADDCYWKIKNAFTESTWTTNGSSGFVAALAAIDGQVFGPEKITVDPDDARYLNFLSRQPVHIVPRILLVRYLAKMITTDDRRFRAAAYRVLRNLGPAIRDLAASGVLPKADLLDLTLFISPHPEQYHISPTYNLASLADPLLSEIRGEAIGWLPGACHRLADICGQDDRFFLQLLPLIQCSTEACKALFPLLIQALLAGASDKTRKKRQTALEDLFHRPLRISSVPPHIINAIIQTVLHLRQFPPHFHPEELGYNLWLDFDFLLLAEAAVKTGAYAAALLFLEIGKADVETVTVDLYDSRVQAIMSAVYSNVNDPDGFYGVKTHNIKDSLRWRLEHEGQHRRAFGLHGANLEAATDVTAATSDLVASANDLHSMGFHQTAKTISQAVRTRDDSVSGSQDLFFEVAWRTGDWDLPVSASSVKTSAGAFYSALRALHRDRSQVSVSESLNLAMKSEMLRLKELGDERMLESQGTVDNLICLREIALWLDPKIQKALSEEDYHNPALTRFGDIRETPRYGLAERLYATRISVLKAAHVRESKNVLGDLTTPLSDALKSLQIKAHIGYSAFARGQDNRQAAINAITAVQHLEGVTMSYAAADEYGEVLWTQEEHSLALQLVQEMIDTLEKGDGKISGAAAGRLGVLTGRLANWSYLARLLPITEAAQMFEQAYTQLTRHRTHETELASLSHDYAAFAAEQQAAMRVSPQLLALREYRSRKEAELQQLEAGANVNRRESKTFDRARADRHVELKEDTKAIEQLEERIDHLVKQALRMFGYSLRYSDKYNDSITKMCSLWLEYGDPKNFSDPQEAKRAELISHSFGSSLKSISSHKFIFLGPQLAARLYRPPSPTTFNPMLNTLLQRIATEHPYHVLYQIIPLAYGVTASGKGRKTPSEQEGRGPAAAELLALLDVNQVNITARTASQQMTAFAEAAMHWSLKPPPNKDEGKQKAYNLPANFAIASINNLSIPVASVIPPIHLNLDYSDIPKLVRYSRAYSLLGGIHRPKKMKAYNTLGAEHFELFKGEDEIRQDAVFEQVFGIANGLLARDRHTKSRNLRFRTYVVIPLANKTGILEFVADGMGVGEWIKPAHDRYRRTIDIKNNEIRDAISVLQKTDINHPQLRPTYEEKMTKFRPVMRHFFTEKHKDPLGWFAMRLMYSRSVAVTSMVGYVLGVGDRHLSNIMIDQRNGEVIHIDFGIVFEEGEKLRIPEKVPFRLTNDMVDGLGITGVDGTFRRCSEYTIRVLRENKELIMTVLEVFKHDPLYAWTGDPDKLQKLQGGGHISHLGQSATVLEKADRVLGKIRQKLSDELSVEYTVNMLIQKARDVDNLAKIFVGTFSTSRIDKAELPISGKKRA